jgi:hypothetical protein
MVSVYVLFTKAYVILDWFPLNWCLGLIIGVSICLYTICWEVGRQAHTAHKASLHTKARNPTIGLVLFSYFTRVVGDLLLYE